MKIRSGFVTNSSSSSYVVLVKADYFPNLIESDILMIRDILSGKVDDKLVEGITDSLRKDYNAIESISFNSHVSEKVLYDILYDYYAKGRHSHSNIVRMVEPVVSMLNQRVNNNYDDMVLCYFTGERGEVPEQLNVIKKYSHGDYIPILSEDD